MERLYYTDPALLEFDATVTQVTPDGERWRVRLDRSAFYPTTGGQPFDTGALNRVRVVDVIDAEDGGVDHITDAPLTVGEVVHGAVDHARRLDHRQQHSGQHILSAAFVHLFAVRTESFHLGGVSSTIDLAREVTPAEIAKAEDEANRVVWEDHPVTIRFVTAEEAAALPLRKEPKRDGPLRLIDIDGFDLSACGGTHVTRTGEIGVIAVRGWERFKGGTRIEFVCGVRAVRALRELRDIVNGSVRLLSVLPAELPAGIERAQAESKELRKQLRDVMQQLAVHEAATLAASAETIGGAPGAPALRAVIAAVDNYDGNGLKTLATSIAATPGHVAALLSTSSPPLVVIARAADVKLDAGALLKALTARFGGKGGGRPELAQGGGFSGTAAEIETVLREALATAAGA
jgi:alanyl-tRNA synthetase